MSRSSRPNFRSTEGTETRRIEIVEPAVQDNPYPDSLADRVYAHMVESAYKRGKLYNMEMPELERLAARHGFDLDGPTGDEKPGLSTGAVTDKEHENEP